MFFISEALANNPLAALQSNPQFMNIGLLVLMFVAMWFFIIRPQQKRQKEHQKLVNSLSIGDEVITIGGLSGKIVEVDTDSIRLQIASVNGEAVVVSFSRMSVQAVLPQGSVKL